MGIIKANRVKNLEPSSAFEMVKRAEILKQKGRDVVSLAIGEPVWNTYPSIKEAGIQGIKDDYTKYTPAKGRTELCAIIQKYVKFTLGENFDLNEIMVSSGCKFSLFSIFQCFCNPNDEVILPAPYWLSYPNIISLSEAKTRIVETREDTDFKITGKQLEENINTKTKIFLLNSPNNPTSAIYSKEELKDLGNVLRKFPNILIVTDDIYDRIVFDIETKTSPHLLQVCPDLKDRMLLLNGASKVFLMTGWRISWLLGPSDLVKILSSFQSQSISCPSSVSQRAIEKTLMNSEIDIANMVKELKSLRDVFYESVKTIPGLKPYLSQGAFYLWVDVKDLIGKKYKGNKIQSSRDIVEYLLLHESLLCLSGEDFGSPGYLRFTYSVDSKTLEKAIFRLKQFVSKLI